ADRGSGAGRRSGSGADRGACRGRARAGRGSGACRGRAGARGCRAGDPGRGDGRVSATISASQVKELRDQTGAGMMDVKNALVETNGDMDAAKRLLREKGIAQAGKRADRGTSEGIVLVTVGGTVGAIAAVGCETEPVSKNDEFVRFAEKA